MKLTSRKEKLIKFVIITSILNLKEIMNYLISNFDKEKISLELMVEKKTN